MTLKGQPALVQQAVKLWPTPDASVSEGFNKGGAAGRVGEERPALARPARLWPTTTTHDAKDTGAPTEFERNSPGLLATTLLHQTSLKRGEKSSGKTRALNPRFVEWLMGWPIGWTDCDSLVTEWFLLRPLALTPSSCDD